MLYITGDTHGDINRFHDKKLKKLKQGDSLIICGDFGFLWDKSPEETENLRALQNRKYNILFADGTHENFELLDSYPLVEYCGGMARKIADNIYHLLRGQVYVIEDKGIFTFGGGESHDLDILLDLNLWQEREVPTMEEMRQGVANIKHHGRSLSYIISHEPPASIKQKIDRNLNINETNLYLDQLMREVTYEKWFFGSLHIDKAFSDKMFAVFNDILCADKVVKARRF